jgi:hypothetical protein
MEDPNETWRKYILKRLFDPKVTDQVFRAGRMFGATTAAIWSSALFNTQIYCSSKEAADRIMNRAKEMGLEIPHPKYPKESDGKTNPGRE